MPVRKESAPIECCGKCKSEAWSVTIEDEAIIVRCRGENCTNFIKISPDYTVDGIIKWLSKKGAEYLSEEAMGLLIKMVMKFKKPDPSES
jgi:hypothetical protein